MMGFHIISAPFAWAPLMARGGWVTRNGELMLFKFW